MIAQIKDYFLKASLKLIVITILEKTRKTGIVANP